MTDRKPRPVRLFPILLVNFIGTLGFSIVLPFLVTLVNRLGGNALVYGVMGATYSGFQLVGAPILGAWSDVYGRRRILLLSQLGTLGSWVIFLGGLFVPAWALFDVDSALLGSFAVTAPLALLFLARALDGLTGGNVSVANAYLADVSPEGERKENFGKMAVAGNLGFIIGPILAGVLGATRYGEVLPVAAALFISLVASVVIALYLPESRPCSPENLPERADVSKVFGQEQRECYKGSGASPRARDVLALPNVPFLLLNYFFIFLGFSLFYTAFPVHAVRGLGWSIAQIGWFFSFLGLTTVLVQGPLLKRLAKRCSDLTLAWVGGIILGAAFLVLTSDASHRLYLGAGLFSLGNGLMWPSFLALLSKAGDRYQGAVQGFGSSVGSLAGIFGLVAGGIAYESIERTTFVVSGAILFCVALALVGWSFRQRLSRSARSV